MTYNWLTQIKYVHGIGPRRSRKLAKIGIETVGNLLERAPNSYVFPGITDIADAKEGTVVIRATVKNIRWKGYHRSTCMVADLKDSTGTCVGEWYGMGASRYLNSGMTAIFYGKMRGGVLQQPRWTTVESTMDQVYGGIYGETHHAAIRAALVEVLAHVELPEMHSGISRVKVFRSYHFPTGQEEQQRALQALKEDECLQLQLALAERRAKREPVKRAEAEGATTLSIVPDADNHIMSHFPYQFTDDQNEAIISILGDMVKPRTMQRLIHGEVASGKSSVAFYAAMLAALNGKRTLILCPTTILADQHYQTLRGMGWSDVYLYGRGGTPPTPHIVIGTHALLHDPMVLREAHLVIIDEMQKFGVAQRAQATKHNPHLLLLSATPIPRSLAMTVLGDLDISVIRELPIKRGTVITKQVLPDRKEAMYEIIEKELAAGHQAYFVYPRISGDEDVESAEQGFKQVSEWFGMYRVKLLTGRANAEDKAGVLHEFYEGDTQILVSTIIAEVGLDCPNATVMVVEGADRFGLSSLHQLRGRICRSTSTAFCFLVSETSNPTSIARLEAIERCNDGFLIAEEDLRLRGAGEVFSTRQHGLPDLKWCSLVDDFDLLQEAKELVASGSVGEGPKEMMCIRYKNVARFGGVV
jgi:ATP-dependent DNA helicase RecG